MSYQVLARKWRPKSFTELVGQEQVVQALSNGLDQDRVHHAFLLTGTRGVGKTTLARILAKCLNCEQGVSSTPCGTCASCVDIDEGRFVDMLEIDAASRTGVEDTRELLDSVQYTPTRGRYKVYIIDEVHMLSRHSFNALLKTLEEPPPHVKFILATTDPQNIPVTILSRCLKFSLRRLLPDQIGGHLSELLNAESVEAEGAAVNRIARAADGSMRDALSLLDQAIAYGGGKVTDDDVANMLGSIDHEMVSRLIECCAAGEAESVLDICSELVAQSRNLETVLADMAEGLHRVALVQLAPGFDDPTRSDWDSIRQLAAKIEPDLVQLFYEIAVNGRDRLGLAPDPRTGLEMTLLRMLAFRPAEAGEAAPPTAGPKPVAAATSALSNDVDEAAASGSSQASAAEKQAPTRTRSATSVSASVPSKEDWPELVGRMQLSGAERELARHLELTGREGSRWAFEIPAALGHMADGRPLEKLTSALSNTVGNPVDVRISTSTTGVESMAAQDDRASNERLQDAQKAIEDDPTVRSLKDRLDAEVVPDSIRPLELDH